MFEKKKLTRAEVRDKRRDSNNNCVVPKELRNHAHQVALSIKDIEKRSHAKSWVSNKARTRQEIESFIKRMGG